MSEWTCVTAVLRTAPEDWAVFDDAFSRHGIDGTVQTDNPPTMSGYAWEPAREMLESLQEELKQLGATSTSITIVPEEDWAESWKQFFKPRRIGTKFVIRPTWEEFPAGPNDLEIVLDPGQAFGTGDHPTTRMCMELLETTEVAGRSLADVGCGSGVLAIAAKLLGAAHVVGSDIDPVSTESTRENIARNAAEVEIFTGRGFEPYPEDATYDIVVSNIISAALINLAPEAARRVNSPGVWIVSGVIEANWPDVRAAAERVGFKYDTHLRENEWIGARFLH